MTDPAQERFANTLAQFEDVLDRLRIAGDKLFHDYHTVEYAWFEALCEQVAQKPYAERLAQVPNYFKGLKSKLAGRKEIIEEGVLAEAGKVWKRLHPEVENTGYPEESMNDMRSDSSVYGTECPAYTPSDTFAELPPAYPPTPATVADETVQQYSIVANHESESQSHQSETSSSLPHKYRILYLSPLWNDDDEERLSRQDYEFKRFDFPRRCHMLHKFHSKALAEEIRVANALYDQSMDKATKKVIVANHANNMKMLLYNGGRELQGDYNAWKASQEEERNAEGTSRSSESGWSTPVLHPQESLWSQPYDHSNSWSSRSNTPSTPSEIIHAPAAPMAPPPVIPQSVQRTTVSRPTTSSRKTNSVHPYRVGRDRSNSSSSSRTIPVEPERLIDASPVTDLHRTQGWNRATGVNREVLIADRTRKISPRGGDVQSMWYSSTGSSMGSTASSVLEPDDTDSAQGYSQTASKASLESRWGSSRSGRSRSSSIAASNQAWSRGIAMANRGKMRETSEWDNVSMLARHSNSVVTSVQTEEDGSEEEEDDDDDDDVTMTGFHQSDTWSHAAYAAELSHYARSRIGPSVGGREIAVADEEEDEEQESGTEMSIEIMDESLSNPRPSRLREGSSFVGFKIPITRSVSGASERSTVRTTFPMAGRSRRSDGPQRPRSRPPFHPSAFPSGWRPPPSLGSIRSEGPSSVRQDGRKRKVEIWTPFEERRKRWGARLDSENH